MSACTSKVALRYEFESGCKAVLVWQCGYVTITRVLYTNAFIKAVYNVCAYYYFLCISRNQLISDDAYSFGDRFLNEERDERLYLVKKETTAVSILYCTCVFVSIMAEFS